MNYIFNILLFSFLFLISIAVIFLYFNQKKDVNTFSAYFNTDGSFAGFIQKKNSLFRACEFSTSGAILSCSNWFDDNLLKQGQNKGLNLKDI